MLCPIYSFTVMLLYVVVLTCTNITKYKTNPRFGTSLWLWPTITSGDIRLPITVELLSHYATTEGPCIEILWEDFQYSPVATTFPIYYFTLETVTMTCHYGNMFTRKQWYCNIQSVLMLGWSCAQTGLTHTVPLGHNNRTLAKASVTHWKVMPTYNCS